MEILLNMRETMIKYFKLYQRPVIFILKFLIGLFLFSCINKIGLYREEFFPLFSGFTGLLCLLLLSMLFAMLPPTVAQALLMVNICLQVSKSLEITVYIFLFISLILVFYSRLSPKKSFLIIGMILGFYFKLPYAVVIFAGLYFGLLSMIPVSIGTFLWSVIPFFKNLIESAQIGETLDIFDLPQSFLDTFRLIFTHFTSDFHWVVTAFVFAMMIVTVYVIDLLNVDYSKYMAIGLGGLMGIVAMFLCGAMTDLPVSPIGVIFSCLVSVALVTAASFFHRVLDYRRAERVQFEDDDNYYYVKIIPKVILNKPVTAKSKRIEPEGSSTGTTPYPLSPRTGRPHPIHEEPEPDPPQAAGFRPSLPEGLRRPSRPSPVKIGEIEEDGDE